MNKNFYDILELNNSASPDDIKKAYKRLVLIHHPDKGGDSAVFQTIQSAYETLKEPEKRGLYDRMGHDMYIAQNSGSNGAQNAHNINLHQMFSQMFNMNVNANHQQRGEDKFINIDVTLDEVFRGVQKTLNVGIIKQCSSCKTACNKCNGNGRIVFMQQNGVFIIRQEIPCDHCHGKGFLSAQACGECHGKYEYIADCQVEVIVPCFVNSGYKMKICEHISKNYTLYGVINITPHDLFKRVGDDLIFTTNISLCESIAGIDLVIPVFDEVLNIDTSMLWGIIKSGTQYTISDKGMYSVNGTRGNLICTMEIQYPKTYLTTEIKQQFRELFSRI